MLKIQFDETNNTVTIEGQEFSQEVFKKGFSSEANVYDTERKIIGTKEIYTRYYKDQDDIVQYQNFANVDSDEEPDGNDIVIRKTYDSKESIEKELKLE